MADGIVTNPAWNATPTLIPFPTARNLDAGPAPTPRTSFIGRTREVERVRDLLSRDEVRLVTLTGPGGVGKTRTAIQSAIATSPFARFVDLADVQQPSLVLPTIAAALDVRPDGRSVLDTLRSALRDDAWLLVLDNFEQVLPAAPLLAEFLDACPHLQLLVTSRVVLGVAGEHVVDIRPFPLPSLGTQTRDAVSVEQALGFEACRLFVHRAQALEPDFALSSDNAATVLSICHRLDGLPLAIELAAAWIPVLSPAALLAQLERRLALPGSGAQDGPQRQRSLRDTIAWSYGLLSESSQTLFRRIAVCNGGCTLDAIQAVCADASLDMLSELRSLVANSLVRRSDPAATISQYTMLETVREFGVECLETSGEAGIMRQRHAAHFLALAEQAHASQSTTERDLWLDRLETEQGNLHGALAWAIEQREAEIAAGLCGALLPFWQFRFHSTVGLDWVRRTLALKLPVSAPVLRKALYCAGTLAYMDGEQAAAATYLADALARALAADDQELAGRVEVGLGRLAWDDDDLEAAQRWFASSRERFTRLGDEVGLAHSLHGLGLVAYKEGDGVQAAAYLRDSLHLWQSFGFTWELARCIPGHLADVARAEGDFATAMPLYQHCLSLNWAAQDLENVSWSLAGLALIAAGDGRWDQAVHLMAVADRFEGLTGAPLTPHIRRDHDLAAAMLLERVGRARFSAIQDAAGSADLDAELAAALALSRGEPASVHDASGTGLTQRERQVLRMVAAGKSNQEIADVLFVSVGTVKVHVTRILAKLDVKSRSAATDYAHRHHLA